MLQAWDRAIAADNSMVNGKNDHCATYRDQQTPQVEDILDAAHSEHRGEKPADDSASDSASQAGDKTKRKPPKLGPKKSAAPASPSAAPAS